MLTDSTLAEFAAALDRALDVHVVAPLYQSWANAPVQVDLAALQSWASCAREPHPLRRRRAASRAGAQLVAPRR